MFTGIIQTTGNVKKLTRDRVIINTPHEIIGQLKKGGSIAVDGACLTVIGLSSSAFTADFMPETAKKTIIGNYKTGQSVNLELAMPADGRFDGHIVNGHVEYTGAITAIRSDCNARIIAIHMPDGMMKYVVPKGSIAVNGISLTVVSVHDNQFTASVIPHTWGVTNLRNLSVGDKVNVETDILGKYVEKLIN